MKRVENYKWKKSKQYIKMEKKIYSFMIMKLKNMNFINIKDLFQ